MCRVGPVWTRPDQRRGRAAAAGAVSVRGRPVRLGVAERLLGRAAARAGSGWPGKVRTRRRPGSGRRDARSSARPRPAPGWPGALANRLRGQPARPAGWARSSCASLTGTVQHNRLRRPTTVRRPFAAALRSAPQGPVVMAACEMADQGAQALRGCASLRTRGSVAYLRQVANTTGWARPGQTSLLVRTTNCGGNAIARCSCCELVAASSSNSTASSPICCSFWRTDDSGTIVVPAYSRSS